MILTNHGSIGYTGPSWAQLTGLLATLPLPLLRMEDLGKARLATRCKMWPDSRWQNLVRPLKFSINRKRACGKKNSSVPSHDACADAIVQDSMTTNDSHDQLYWLLVHFPALSLRFVSRPLTPCTTSAIHSENIWKRPFGDLISHKHCEPLEIEPSDSRTPCSPPNPNTPSTLY